MRFLKKEILNVPFFANLDEATLYKVIFSLVTRKYQKNAIF